MMLSPGYIYEKAPDQNGFLHRDGSKKLFKDILSTQEELEVQPLPLFLKFLQGDFDFECTPWGSPAYNVFGWQKPCYLLQDGYVKTFKEYIEDTAWENTATRARTPSARTAWSIAASSLRRRRHLRSWAGSTRRPKRSSAPNLSATPCPPTSRLIPRTSTSRWKEPLHHPERRRAR